MNFRHVFVAVVASLAAFAPPPSFAQVTQSLDVQACGTPPSTRVAGGYYPDLSDLTGVRCTSSTGGGGGGAITAASGSYASGSIAAGAIVDIGTGASPGANTTNGLLKSLLTSNSGILGVDGATIATLANPFPTTAGLVAGSANIGSLTNITGAISLPTGAATSAKQPALGTAGTPSTDVLTVQGSGSGTALPVSVATLPALPANQSVNLAQVAGATTPVGHGVAAAALRLELPTDGSGVVGIQDKNAVKPDFTITAPVAQVGPYPSLNTAGVVSSATPETCSSGNVANATVACTLAASSGKTTYITGLIMTADGATVGLAVSCTITGTITGTLTFTFAYPAGVAVQSQPLIIPFPYGIPASATNTTIVVSCPASGTGGTNAAISATGFQL